MTENAAFAWYVILVFLLNVQCITRLIITPLFDFSLVFLLPFPQSGFQDFQLDTLKYYECLVLNKIQFSASPQITPISFVREFLYHWQPTVNNSELLELSDFLIANFWEGNLHLE